MKYARGYRVPIPEWMDDSLRQDWLFKELEPDQQPLNEGKVKVVIGQFYEALAAHILVGEFGERPAGWLVYPDVVIWGAHQFGGEIHDVLVEVKGGSKRYGFIVDTGQTNEYENLQNCDFPFTQPEVMYLFFIHDLTKIETNHKTVDELIQALTKHTLAAVAMPLSIVKELEDILPLNGYAGWSNGSRGGPGHEFFVRLSSYRMHRWATGDEGFHDGIDRLAKKNDRTWNRNGWVMRDEIITGAKIKDYVVSDFPMLAVREKGTWDCFKRIPLKKKKVEVNRDGQLEE